MHFLKINTVLGRGNSKGKGPEVGKMLGTFEEHNAICSF